MKEEHGPIVNVIGKESYYVHCPFCGREYCFGTNKRHGKVSVHSGNGFTRTIEHATENVVCDDCGNEYTIDFGEDIYTIYNTLVPRGSIRKVFAKFESALEYNFEIIVTDWPEFGGDNYTVESENEDYSFLLMSPFVDDLYKKPYEIIKLAKAHADREVYPNFH